MQERNEPAPFLCTSSHPLDFVYPNQNTPLRCRHGLDCGGSSSAVGRGNTIHPLKGEPSYTQRGSLERGGLMILDPGSRHFPFIFILSYPTIAAGKIQVPDEEHGSTKKTTFSLSLYDLNIHSMTDFFVNHYVLYSSRESRERSRQSAQRQKGQQGMKWKPKG
ncbi:hypothetical protein P167DRAFT_86188 [Morchella conica CCBAS932]|uniref:Uncharacterized protein n=1 Tax=Morchella conica CCBAS932 TaxID=1392247 RepID=A0A3N4KWR2_9PEZI|nr:hypothetical protein P167DRAFT_86188 [Morchella conica CCBAS932]